MERIKYAKNNHYICFFFILTAIIIIIIFNIKSFVNNDVYNDYLIENEDYSFVFIVYSQENSMTRRYTVYPEGELNFTKGWRKKEFIITDPLCFDEIFVSEQINLSNYDLEIIFALIEKIDIQNIGFGDDVIQQGGNRYFISYNGVSCEIYIFMFHNSEYSALMGDDYDALMEIEQILEEYFGSEFQACY